MLENICYLLGLVGPVCREHKGRVTGLILKPCPPRKTAVEMAL